MRKLWLGWLLTAGGCGADVVASCEDYVSAINTCYADYAAASGVDMSAAMVSGTYCADSYAGTVDPAAAETFDCLAEVYGAADCADPSAYAEIDSTTCGG